MSNIGAVSKERVPQIEQQILRTIRDVRYGSVEIIIHDSQVVQIERKEKIRFGADKTENRR